MLLMVLSEATLIILSKVQTFSLFVQDFHSDVGVQRNSTQGLLVHDDPSTDHWVWHLKPVPKQSTCTVGVAYTEKVPHMST